MAGDRGSDPGTPADTWRQVFDTMSEGLAICELILDDRGRPRDYRHLHVNKAFGELSGGLFSSSDSEGRTARELVPDLEEEWVEFFGKVVLSGTPASWTTYVKALDRWVDARAFSLGGLRFAFVYQDITERRKADRELAKFALLVEESRDFIAMSDLKGNCTFLNAAGRRLVGLEAGGEKGKRVVDFMFPEDWDHGLRAMEAAMREGGWEGETRLRHFLTGKAVPVHGTLFCLKDESGHAFAVASVGHDLTVVREKEEQLRQAQKMEAIGKLAGGVAHDFNNLLTAINGYGDMLLEATPEGDPRRDFLQEIRAAGQRAASLTSQLLAYSRKQVLRPQVLQLNAVVEEGARLLRRIIGENIELRVDAEPDLLAVTADPNQMHQILFNLVLNARDAMPEGGVLTLKTRNADLAEGLEGRHGALPAGRYALLEVADTGIGMPEEVQARIFEPFFTTKEVGAGPAGRTGTGLGLPGVYGILQQSGGGIVVESAPGKGSIFRIYLPALEAGERGKAALELEEAAKPPPGRGRILLVEDEEAVRTFVRSHLESIGYTVMEARNGLEAMASLNSPDTDPDLLLTDVVMPRMGGVRLAESVRILRPDLPILFMSGYAEDALSLQIAERPDAPQFLQKPFSAGALARKIGEMLWTQERRAPGRRGGSMRL